MSIELKNITMSYGENKVIENVTFTIPDTGIFGIFGPSGGGKTTLLRLICGLEKQESGTITGTDGKKISVMFQEDRLLPCSVLKNVSIVSEKETALKYLEKVGLGDSIDKYPAELSGGMARRVAFARAMAYKGDILVLDEPFKGLDPELKAKIYKIVKNYAENHTVILVSHDEESREAADNYFEIV